MCWKRILIAGWQESSPFCLFDAMKKLIAVAFRYPRVHSMTETDERGPDMTLDLIEAEADAPVDVTLKRDGRALVVAWRRGDTTVIAAETLRAACWCAWCRVDRVLGRFPACFDDAAIETVQGIGGYAIHVAFTDGHARGIYPWPYLRAVAEGRAPPAVEPLRDAISRHPQTQAAPSEARDEA